MPAQPRLPVGQVVALLALGVGSSALAQSHVITIIHVNTPGHPSNVVPGLGLPFLSGGGSNSGFGRPWVSPNGQHLAYNIGIANSTLATDEGMLVDDQLVLREGNPAPWPTAGGGELVASTFFASIGINDLGDVVINHNTIQSGQPVNTNTANDDYIVAYQGGVWSTLAYESTPVNPTLPGLVGDVGTAIWRDTMDSCQLTNGGQALWRATGIANLTTGTLNDAVINLGNGTALQKGVTIPAGQAGGAQQTWENFDQNRLFVSNVLTLVQGDLTGATTSDDVLVYAGAVVIQEGSVVPGSSFASPVATDGIASSWLDHAGLFFCRGSNADGTDWVVRQFNVVANSGGTDEIVAGSGEHWDDARSSTCFFAFDGNAAGHYLLGGTTDNADPLRDAVLVLDDGNGFRRVVAREGDPIDLDGNGLFDDSRYLHTFATDRVLLLDDDSIIVSATMKNSPTATTGIENGLFKLVPRSPACAIRNGNNINPLQCSCLTPAVAGTNFVVGLSPNANTLTTVVGLAFAPIPPLSLFGGEILIDPTADLYFGAGNQTFPVPTALRWLGATAYLQGGRLDNIGGVPTIVLLNGLDVTVGH